MQQGQPQTPLTLDQIKAQCPFPWRTGVDPRAMNRIIVVDARGGEVPIFHMTRFCEILTEKMAPTQ